MTSYRLSISPHRRAAARFVGRVRRSLLKAYDAAPHVTQSSIAKELGVHRSVINRQIRGTQDMSLGRVAELACILGYEPDFRLLAHDSAAGANTPVRETAGSIQVLTISGAEPTTAGTMATTAPRPALRTVAHEPVA